MKTPSIETFEAELQKGVEQHKEKKPKRESRTARWARLAADAQSLADQLSNTLSELRSIQEEYESWRDNIEEKFGGTALFEKLDTVCNIDIDGAIGEADGIRDGALDEACQAELPQGFGRD